MLQKLTTHKHIIKSSDITKDRNTSQVELRLEGKKRTDTGGLSGTLTVAENAFVRLTSNIDVAIPNWNLLQQLFHLLHMMN